MGEVTNFVHKFFSTFTASLGLAIGLDDMLAPLGYDGLATIAIREEFVVSEDNTNGCFRPTRLCQVCWNS